MNPANHKHLSKYLLLLPLFLIVSFFAAEKAVAQGVCSTIYSVGTCGGETNAQGAFCTCQPGWKCMTGGSSTCGCVADTACGATTVICDATREGQCGTAGGCGYSRLKCISQPVMNGTTYVCSNDYTTPCTCQIGVTCPDDDKSYCLGSGACFTPAPTSLGDYTSGEWIYNEPEYQGPIITDIAGLLAPVFKILFYAGIFIGILGIIYSGYLLIASEGDPGRAKEGKDQLTAAILGTLFVLLSVLILRVIINNILGVTNSGL